MVLERLIQLRDLLSFDRKQRPFVRPRPDGTVRRPRKLRPRLETLEDRLVPATFYVDDNFSSGAIADADLGTTGNQPATFGTNAFNTIGAALAASAAADTIIVNSGIYNEAVNLTGTRILRITGPDVPGAVTIGSLAGVAGTSVEIVGSSALTVGDATNATFSGTISGSGSLTKVGGGTLTLAGANTYTGATTVSAGVLSVAILANGGVASGIGQSSNAFTNLVLNGGTLAYTGASVTIDRGMTIDSTNGGTLSIASAAANLTVTGVVRSNISAGATLTKTGAGTLTLGGTADNFFLGLTVNAGQVNLAKDSTGIVHAVGQPLIINNGGTVQLAGSGGDQIVNPVTVTVNGGSTFDLNGRDETVISLTLNDGSVIGAGILTATSTYNVRSGTASAVLAGSAGLTKSTTGTVTLSAANTYTGATQIDGGVLSVAILESGGGPSGIGQSSNAASNLVLNGGTLEYTGGTYVIDRNITVNTIGGTLSVANAATFLAVTGAVRSSSTNSDAILTKTGSGSLSLGGTGDNAFLHLHVNAGQVDLAKINSVSSHAANNVTVNAAGTVRLAGTGGDQVFSNVTVNGGTFDLNGRSEVLAGLVLNGGSVIGSGSVTSNSTYDVRSGTISAVLAGSVGLTKSDSGTVTLSGANTYTGATTVSAGTLVVNGSLAGLLTVADGGTLAGSGGTVSNAVAVGGTLAPGSGGTTTGSLTLGNLSFPDAAAVNVNLNGTTAGMGYDQIIGTGSVSLANATLNVTVGAGFTPTVGTTFTILDKVSTGATGTFTNGATVSTADGYDFSISYTAGGGDNNNVLLTLTDLPLTVTINQAASQSDPSNTLPLTWDVVFSESVTGFAAGDLIRTGTATGGTLNVSGSGATYTVTLNGAVTHGTVTLAVAAGAATGGGDANLASTSTDNTVSYNAPPTVTINQASGQADPTNTGPILFTVIFNEPVTDFDDAADIAFTGSTAPGTLSATITPMNGTTYTVTVSGMTSSGTVVASVVAGAALDSGSNASLASTSTDKTVTYDNVAPTADVTDVSPDPRNSNVGSITIVFSEAISGFDLADLSLTRDNGANLLTGSQTLTSGNNVTWTLSNLAGLTAAGGSYQLTLKAADAGIADLAGNALAGDASDSWLVDLTAPTVTINQAAGQDDPATPGPVEFTVVFSEAVTGFTAADVSLTGSTAPGPPVVAVSGSGTTYTVTVSNLTGPGTVVAVVGAGAAQDAAGNPSLASTSTDNSVTVVGTVIATVSPAANSHTAPVGTNLQATFDQALNPATVTDATFVVHGTQTGRLEAADGDSFGASGATVTVNPFANFHAGELVQVTATGGLQGVGGDSAFPRVWQFRTAATGGSGNFSSFQTLPSIQSTWSVALGDVDGDGDIDAFMGNRNEASRVWKNDGNGNFTNFQTLPTSHTTLSVALGDVDGDGDLDAFMGNQNDANMVWKNDGSGTFSSFQSLTAGHDPRSVALGDVDGDGDLDAFLGNYNQASTVWKNDGSGTFSSFQTLPSSYNTRSVALGDVDGDGDLDAILGNHNQASMVWKNDGSGTFSSSQNLSGGISAPSVALGDVDGDGDLDAFLGHENQASRVWKNDGSGVFTDSGQALGNHRTRSVALGDVDGDGDLDAFQGNDGGDPSRVWKNNGSGTFSSFQTLPSSHFTRSVALGDVDGDGDLDAFMGNNGHASRVWKNDGTPAANVMDVSPDPRNSAVATITIVFSEAVNGFNLADLSLTRNGGANLLTGSQTLTTSDNVTWTLGNLAGLTAAAGNYQLTLTAAGSGITDLTGNALAGDASDSWLVDLTAPTVTINQAAGQADPTNALPLTFTVVFSEAVTGLTAGDLVRTGTSTGGTLNVSGSGTTYTVTLTGAVTAGTVTLAVAAGAAADTAGNASTASTSTDNTITYETTAPTADVTDVSPDPRNSAVGSISIVFSEAISGFDLADLSLTRDGGANLLTGSQTLTSADNVTWTLGNLTGLTAAAGSYQLTLTAAGSGITDLAGNALSGDASDIWTTDLTAPTADVTDVSPDPRTSAVASITIVFSEAVNGFDLADLSLTRDSGANLLTGSQTLTTSDNVTWTLGNLAGLTAAAGSYQLTLTAAGSGITDLAGNALAGNASDNWVMDVTVLTVTINQAAGQADPTNASPVQFTVVFSEPVTGFDASDLSFAGSTAPGSLTPFVSGSGTTYTVMVFGMTGSGTVVASVNAGAATNAANDVSLASTSSDNSVTFDNVAPTVTINQAAGQSDPTNVLPLTFTVVFSEPVTGFAAGDLIRTGTATGGTLNVTGSGTTYTVTLSGAVSPGTVTLAVAGSAAQDTAGNASLASTSSDNTVTYDNVAPTVTINQAAGQADPTNAGPVLFTVVFSEVVTDFDDAADIAFTGSTAPGSLSALITPINSTTYTVSVSGMTGSGTVVASVVAGAALDGGGNVSLASTSTDNIVTFDTTIPNVTINQAMGQSDPTSTLPISFGVVFSEVVTGFNAGDLVRTGTATGGTLNVSGSGTTYTVTLSGAVTAGTVTLTVAAGAATDAAGNASAASISTDNTVTYDNVAPTVTINQAVGQNDLTNSGPVQFTVVFSEPVTGFDANDVSLTDSTVSGTLTAAVSGNGSAYTVLVFGMSGSGAVIASVNANAAVDAAGNTSLASTSTDNTVMFDNLAPTVTINQAAGQSDPTNALPLTFAVVFSEPVTGFDAAELIRTGTSAGGTLNVSGSGSTYTVTLSGLVSPGTVTLSVAADAAVDAAGNTSMPSTNTDNTVSFNNVAPTADIINVSPDPRKDAVNSITIVFSEVIGGFDLADLQLTRNGGSNLLPGSATLTSGDNVTWTLGNLAGLTTVGGSYQLTLTATGSGITDAAGNTLAGNASDGWVLNLSQYAVGQGTGGTGIVRVLYAVDNSEHFRVTPYAVPGEVRVAMADVNGDGTTDLITAPGKGQLGTVKVYNGLDGTPFAGAIGGFVPFAGWTRGLFVAAGDTNHDNSNAGRAEIFIGQDKGGGQVKVFHGASGTWTALKTIKPFGGTYKGGVTVAAGDTDGNDGGVVELISGKRTGVTQIRIHEAVAGSLVRTFTAFSGLNRGVYLAAGDIDGDGRDEVFASLASGSLGLVKVLNPATGIEINSTLALGSSFTGGLRVGVTDRDGDGRAEVLVAAGPSPAGGPRLEMLDGTTLAELDAFFADDNPAFAGGLFVS